MYAGRPFFCLRARDIDASRHFYETLGLAVVEEVPDKRITFERGSFRITLMTFLDEDLLNFRGADAFAIHDHLDREGVSASGEPERYRKEKFDADADGACWLTRDPDGHAILFDTNENEEGESAAQESVDRALRCAEQDLIDAGASDACLEAYRQKILIPFLAGETRGPGSMAPG
jgi:catechol 2,3-dioxygenase-like lactoylglutathione lyase family enzyme